MAALEERLGARLLQRTTRQLGLTDAGRTFQEYAARIVADAEEAGRAITRLQAAPRGLLRVTVPMSQGYLGAALGEFLKGYPDVTREVISTDRVVDLEEERFDVALRAGKLADSTLIARPVTALRAILVAAPSYLRARGALATPADLTSHDCLLFGPTAARGTWQLVDGAKTVDVAFRARVVANDMDLLRDVTVAGLGISLMPERTAAAEVKAKRLSRVLAPWRAPDVPLYAVYPTGRHLSPKVSAFVDWLQRELGSR